MRESRTVFAEKYLKGKGIEFGALNNPLPVNMEQCTVTYADKSDKKELLSQFPELRPVADSIVETDIRMDLNSCDFSQLQSSGYDFFIANHLLEHLVNPIKFLKNLHDIMDKRAVLYLSVPDKEYTFDKPRQLTDNDHLWEEYSRDTSELSDAHLLDFIIHISKDHIDPGRRDRMYFKNDRIPWNWFKKKRILALHRQRSIHVHVWNKETFASFLEFTFNRLDLEFSIVDSCGPEENEQHELLYILQKR